MKIHANKNGVTIIAIPKLGCGLDQMIWSEVVRLLHDIFVYADVQIVVYKFEENGVQAMSAKGHAEFNPDDEIERYNEDFFCGNRELGADSTKASKSCQPTRDEEFPVLHEKDYNNHLIDHYLQHQHNKVIKYVKEFDLRYSHNTDEKMILLIDMLADTRDVYSQHKVGLAKTR